jgi:hypothetical protein
MSLQNKFIEPGNMDQEQTFCYALINVRICFSN